MADAAAREERKFWAYYAQRALALVESAEHRGLPLWEVSAVPKAAAMYAVRAVEELRRCLAGKTPWLRKRNLTNEARRFQNLKAWRAEIPALADCFRKPRFTHWLRNRVGEPPEIRNGNSDSQKFLNGGISIVGLLN